jgi:opacity protein-like surface antigen
MAKLGPLVLAGIAAACGGWARAADLPPAPSLPPPSSADSQFGGWYLRGDAGVGVNSTAPELRSAGAATRTFGDTTLSPFGMIDVGGGYQFNGMFRADGTLEYRALARLRSPSMLTDSASPHFGDPAPFGGFDRANVASFVGLINGYATPGTWYGFAPFLGAGVGFADNRLSGFTDASGGHVAGGSTTSFAWALMAGVDFDFTSSLKLEASYRYLNYGAIAAGAISSRNRLASNDFRLGLIYLIGEGPSLPGVAGY